MEKIHILTDSSSDIPQALVEQHGIEIVPIMLSHGGRTFREYYDITPAECCRLLEESDEIPSTAMATPAVFLESYNRAFERGCTHLIGVIINGSGSGTDQAACLAEGNVRGGARRGRDGHRGVRLAYLYLHLWTHCRQGGRCASRADFEAITSVIRSRLSRVEAYLGVYTLKYLKKSGRISGGAAFVGEALGLKPISFVYDGAVKVCDKVHGEKALAGPASAKRVAARVQQPEKQDRHPALRRCARGASGRGQKAHARGDRLQGRRPLCDRPVRSEQYRPARHRCCVLRRAARVKKIVKNVEYFPVFRRKTQKSSKTLPKGEVFLKFACEQGGLRV